MHRTEHHQELAALARWTFQHVVQVGARKALPQAIYHPVNVHGLVEIAARRIGAVEVQPVRAGQVSKGVFLANRCHGLRRMP